jgi:hypothetical protein
MADVSLDDLIKQDREKHKVNRVNKVLLHSSRSPLKRMSHKAKGSRTAIIKAGKTMLSANRMTTVPSKRNSSRRITRIETLPENPDNSVKRKWKNQSNLERTDPMTKATKSKFEH